VKKELVAQAPKACVFDPLLVSFAPKGNVWFGKDGPLRAVSLHTDEAKGEGGWRT
jgi:hypothetical protein